MVPVLVNRVASKAVGHATEDLKGDAKAKLAGRTKFHSGHAGVEAVRNGGEPSHGTGASLRENALVEARAEDGVGARRVISIKLRSLVIMPTSTAGASL